VGIANMTRQVADFGFLPLLNLVAILSVSIGLINLFPIPLLDGGHLLYYAVEAVLGRPLGERAQDIGFRLGLVFVLGLMLLTTWNDLVRLNLF
jgi:regulator of sigma E protease